MIRLAAKEARRSRCNNQHGAVVAKKNRVLGKGCNMYKSHPKWGAERIDTRHSLQFFTIHAEANAIRRAVNKGIDVRGATIYVTRTGSQSQLSRPCADCQKLIEEYGIRKVVYTDEEGNIIDEYPYCTTAQR